MLILYQQILGGDSTDPLDLKFFVKRIFFTPVCFTGSWEVGAKASHDAF